MKFQPISSFRSPHYSARQIPVEFAVLHYTALSLEGSLKAFLDKKGPPISAHLLIDEGGRIFELVPCWRGVCLKAFHAGESRWKGRKDFNSFSIGIELVSFNGNIFPFAEEQYQALFQALRRLCLIYPQLKKPWRVLGHEHISGFRGKKDPGALFHWRRLYQEVFQVTSDPPFSPALSKRRQSELAFCKAIYGNDQLSRKVSLILERADISFSAKKRLLLRALQRLV